MGSKKFGKLGESFKRLLTFGTNSDEFSNEDTRKTFSHYSKRNSLDTTKKAIKLQNLTKVPPKFLKLVYEVIHFVDGLNQLDGLLKIAQILEEDFYYDCKRLHRGRNAFLTLWDYILRVLENQTDSAFLDVYRRILIQLILRREFNLEDFKGQLDAESERSLSICSYDIKAPNPLSSLNSDEEDPFSNDQDLTGHLVHYRRLLIATFRVVTRSLDATSSKKNIGSIADMEFYSMIIAVIFIRVPYIQQRILVALTDATNSRIWDDIPTKSKTKDEHSKSSQFELHLQQLISQFSSSPSPFTNNKCIFGWMNFVPYIGGIGDERLLQLNSGEWLKRIATDGEFAFMIIIQIIQHVHLVASNYDIVWSQVPGYSLTIEIAMRLLKEACWTQWWILQETDHHENVNSMKQKYFVISTRGLRTILKISSHLLVVRELVNCMLLALYESTNIYDTRSVGLCLTQLEQWIGILQRSEPQNHFTWQHESIGDNEETSWESCFDLALLSSGIKKMIAMESFETLKKVLLFLYNILDKLTGLLRQKMLAILLQQHYRLFLHWNIEVRSYYHHILVYKVSYIDRRYLESFTDRLFIPECPHVSDDPLPVKNIYNEHIKIERAYWRAFDACIAVVCMVEREKVNIGKVKHDFDVTCAKNKHRELENLNSEVPKLVRSDITESRPVVRTFLPKSVNLMQKRLPYYYRYLPAEETSELKQLCTVAQSMHYRQPLRVYAYAALQEYSSLLTNYYEALESNGSIEGPPLGFC